MKSAVRERGEGKAISDAPFNHAKIRTFVASGLILMLLSATGCGCLGSGQQTVETRTTTLGQELSDLQKAHESGAIDDKQYEKAKTELLKKYNAD